MRLRLLFLNSDSLFPGLYFPVFEPINISLPVRSTHFDCHKIKLLLTNCMVNAQKYSDLSPFVRQSCAPNTFQH